MTISGLRRLVESGVIGKDDLTVAYVTGNGLKTQEAVEDKVDTVKVKATMESFKQALGL